MRHLLPMLSFLLALAVASAVQGDTFSRRPTGDALQFKASHTDGAVVVCMFRVDQDYLNPTNHRGCTPMGGLATIVSAYPIDRGEGDLEYRAVAVDGAGRISEPSVDSYLVEDIPAIPVLGLP